MVRELGSWVNVVIAVFVAFVGYLQWRTAQLQWRTGHNRFVLDQFEKRYEIYQTFRKVVEAIVGSSANANRETSVRAVETCEKARFLFGDDVVTYLDQLTKDIGDLESIVTERRGDLKGDDLKKNVEKERELRNRIEEFRSRGTALFSKYIRFDQEIH